MLLLLCSHFLLKQQLLLLQLLVLLLLLLLLLLLPETLLLLLRLQLRWSTVSGIHKAQLTCAQRPSSVGLSAPPVTEHSTHSTAGGSTRERGAL